jgi:hypothetical protein
MPDPNIPSGNFVVLGVAVAVAVAVVLLLQYVGKTPIRDDYDLPPVTSPQR